MALLVCLPPRLANAHPLHTSIAEITADPSGRTLRAMIRVFADDFTLAATRHRGAGSTVLTDAAALAYLQTTFVLTDRSGRRLSLRACGARRAAELLWICVETNVPGGVAGTSLRNGVLCDLHSDQVNIVRSRMKGPASSLLFTRTTPARVLT